MSPFTWFTGIRTIPCKMVVAEIPLVRSSPIYLPYSPSSISVSCFPNIAVKFPLNVPVLSSLSGGMIKYVIPTWGAKMWDFNIYPRDRIWGRRCLMQVGSTFSASVPVSVSTFGRLPPPATGISVAGERVMESKQEQQFVCLLFSQWEPELWEC